MLEAVSHCWVASLANYNFQLYYRAGKSNINADALSRVSWLGCMPNTSNTHLWVTAAVVWAVQKAAPKGLTKPNEAYSCDLQILDPVGDGLQVVCMTLDDWHWAQQADPILGLMIVRLQDGTLGQCQLEPANSPELWQFLWECNLLKLSWGVQYRKTLSRESQEALFQLVPLAVHRETALRGCHNEVGHLGLEQMLDLMHYNRLSIIESFTSRCIWLYCVTGCQAEMTPNKHFFIKDNLCLITCNKKSLYGVRSDELYVRHLLDSWI